MEGVCNGAQELKGGATAATAHPHRRPLQDRSAVAETRLGGGTAARERSGGICAICRGDSGEARRCGSALSVEPVPCCVEFAASWCCRTNSRMAAPNFPVTTCDWFVPIPRP